MAAVALLVAIPVTLLTRGGSEPSAEPNAGSAEPPLGREKHDRDLDARLRIPLGWSRERSGEVLTLKSADRSARLALSAPGPAGDADQLRSEVIQGIRRSFTNVRTLEQTRKGELGGLNAETVALAATTPKADGRAEVRILVSTARGRRRAYVAAVFTPAEDPGRSALEAQALLNELRLNG